jgi:hypothetical protein
LRFGDSFRNALQHFEANGVEVNAFEGDWSYMTEDEISDNLRVFREEMAKGGTREAAALKTPTAKVATRSGFELTSVENVPESQEHLAEQGVRRWRVKALFRRQVPVQKPGPPGGAPAVTFLRQLLFAPCALAPADHCARIYKQTARPGASVGRVSPRTGLPAMMALPPGFGRCGGQRGAGFPGSAPRRGKHGGLSFRRALR